jgi:hypothetical protein
MVSKLYVAEYAELQIGPAGRHGQVPLEPPVAEQVVDFSGGVAASNAFNAATRLVRLHADSICAIEFGTNPTVIAAGATGTARMAANQTEYYGVPLGAGLKVSAISST